MRTVATAPSASAVATQKWPKNPKACALNPASAEAYNNRGVAYKHLGRLEQAIEDYSRAVEWNPRFGLAYCNRGIALGMQGKTGDAISDFSAALSLQPALTQALLERGRAYARVGRRDLAKEDLWQACEQSSVETCAELRSLGGRGR